LDGRSANPVDRRFTELPSLLRAGDLIVFNDTQVVKARLFGQKSSGGKVELLIERVLAEKNAAGAENRIVAAHMKVSKKPAIGGVLQMDGGYSATLLGRWPDANGQIFRLELSADAYALMAKHGHVPLPPYIEHADAAEDERRYQTVFAQNPGAVAAPTASLHFDETTLQTLADMGVEQAFVTLHVGAGTFAPVKSDNLAEHVMHHERYTMPQATIDAIARTRARSGRVIAVGTTTVRTLESWAQTGQMEQVSGDTNIFITPGFNWQVVDMLLTNFHLPRSTLMMLVSALAGHAHIMALYQHAVAQQYRFFSYGDCMLLQKA
jgi:S-adenosylmethionine:tRNA ribosyltransferase-isomerase